MSNEYYNAAKKVEFNFINRKQLVELYSYAVPSDNAINAIAELPGNYILEVGAGTGYWASLIEEKGKKVVCTDNFSWGRPSKRWHEIEELDALSASLKYKDADILLVVWPPMNILWLDAIVKQFKYIVYVGESTGGCTADLELDWKYKRIEIQQWEGVHDHVRIYEKP